MGVNHNNVRDLTGNQPARGPGMAIDRLFLCGHKGQSKGAFVRAGIGMRCANCQRKVLERAA
jgi:hypothetical protein